MNRRALVVTGIVALAGGVAGAAGGGLIMAAIDIATGSPFKLDANTIAFYAFAKGIGFAHGFVLGPVLAWTFLRDAPLWRAVGETALAASIAGGVAILAGLSIFAASGAAILASGLAAIRLRRSLRRLRPAAPAATRLPPVEDER
jgi:hypothetical protein